MATHKLSSTPSKPQGQNPKYARTRYPDYDEIRGLIQDAMCQAALVSHFLPNYYPGIDENGCILGGIHLNVSDILRRLTDADREFDDRLSNSP
ncbi:MAG: hypothetical protein ACRD2B_04525 [Terriglobia bacterium]